MNRTKLFFDMEFTGLYQDAQIISIGIESDCGKSFYAELNDYNPDYVNDWVVENVLPYLTLDNVPNRYDQQGPKERLVKGCISFVATALKDWLSQWSKSGVEFWGDVCQFDWVLMHTLFHTIHEQLPSHVYYIPFDLATLINTRNLDPDLSRLEFSKIEADLSHHALFDARMIKTCYHRLMGIPSKSNPLQNEFLKGGWHQVNKNGHRKFYVIHPDEYCECPAQDQVLYHCIYTTCTRCDACGGFSKLNA